MRFDHQLHDIARLLHPESDAAAGRVGAQLGQVSLLLCLRALLVLAWASWFVLEAATTQLWVGRRCLRSRRGLRSGTRGSSWLRHARMLAVRAPPGRARDVSPASCQTRAGSCPSLEPDSARSRREMSVQV